MPTEEAPKKRRRAHSWDLIYRVLNSVKDEAHRTETSIQQGAGVNPDVYADYRDHLLGLGLLLMRTTPEGRPRPVITAAGLDAWRDLDRARDRLWPAAKPTPKNRANPEDRAPSSE